MMLWYLLLTVTLMRIESPGIWAHTAWPWCRYHWSRGDQPLSCCCWHCCCDRATPRASVVASWCWHSLACIIVTFHQGTVGSLPAHQGAPTFRGPVKSKCSRGSGSCERSAVTAGQLFNNDVHPKFSCEILVVVGSVCSSIPVGGTSTTFQGSINDHGSGSETRFQIGSWVSCVGCPCEKWSVTQHSVLVTLSDLKNIDTLSA